MPNDALDPLLTARDRLFRVLFCKISLLYARTLSPSVRTLVEFGILTKVGKISAVILSVLCIQLAVYSVLYLHTRLDNTTISFLYLTQIFRVTNKFTESVSFKMKQ